MRLMSLFMLFFIISISSSVMGLVGHTNSMYPTFTGGELVELIPSDTAEIGDIVVFYDEKGAVMHRVWAKWYGCYITKGDNNWVPDLGCQKIEYQVDSDDL